MKKENYDLLIKLLKDESGIDLGADREHFLETRLADILKNLNLKSIDELVELKLKSNKSPQILESIICSLTTNESFFFRDGKPFLFLEKSALPAILKSKGSHEKIKIWSAASSNGQEAYSIAITILEYFPEISPSRIEIMATDIDKNVLEYARKGIFSKFEVNRGVSDELKGKYFKEATNGNWEVKDHVKQMVTFSYFNLISPNTLNILFDIVFLRNVIIYFDNETKKYVLEKIYKHMNDNSFLILGGSESTLWITEKFKRYSQEGCTYYRKSGLPKILIVEDEPDMSVLVKDILLTSLAGKVEIEIAHNGLEGHAKCMKNNYDLIITDHHMPKLTGTEMIKKIFQENIHYQSKPFLIVSAYVEEFKTDSPEIKNVFFLNKPVDGDKLIRNVNLLLAKSSMAA